LKRKETTLGGSVGESILSGRSKERDRSSKRHNIRIRVSREDTKSSSSRVKEEKFRSPWLLRYGTTSMKDEAQSRDAN
jgi:hypothetical protein